MRVPAPFADCTLKEFGCSSILSTRLSNGVYYNNNIIYKSDYIINLDKPDI
jgi:hypothetical protein